MASDRNLLFGALAMQTGLITAEQFAQACNIWATRNDGVLADVLCEQGWLEPGDSAHFDYLVERQLAKVGGDVHASLAGMPADVRSVLAVISDDTHGEAASLRTLAYEEKGDSATKWTPKSTVRYQLNTLHAAGGIGEIWLARDVDLERDVAVKRLQSKSAVSEISKLRFLREAKITGQLDHPGVVPIYEICVDETTGQPYYSMRFLKGQTLTEVVKAYHQRRLKQGADTQSLLNLLYAFCIVCNTVAYAHSKGIVHRDLKCDNVILGDYGEVVVIDWGLAKEVGGQEVEDRFQETAELVTASPAATLAGHILGSPAYMAPEQAAGLIDVIGPRTDVYGLSAILYEILCGQPPFLGRNTLEVLAKVTDAPPPQPSDISPGIPEGLEQICLKGLEKLPSRRHRSADSLAQAVQAWVSDLAERRQAEEERERFFALSLDLLAIIGDDGRLRQFSPAWERLLGYERQQLSDRLFVTLIHSDDQHLVNERLRQVTATESSDCFEARALYCDGNYRWVSWNVTPIAKERSVYVVGRDITELKRSQRLFEGVLQSAPDAMVIINAQGQIVMVNQQTERVFGYRQDELMGQPVEVLVPDRFRRDHPAHVAQFFAAASIRPMGAGAPLKGRRKDGTECEVDIALSPISIEDTQLVAASVRDISSRNRPGQEHR